MKLWLLRPKEGLKDGDNPWEPWYDKCFGFVVRAETEGEARQIAHGCAGDENRGEFMGASIAKTGQPWQEKKYSTCVELTPDGESGVVIEDVHSA